MRTRNGIGLLPATYFGNGGRGHPRNPRRRGRGTLSGVTTVQRINTHGGVVNGACDRAGAYFSAPYSADYVFLRK